ncbi:MAG: putative toxin-antitoxin system toxin component, PIN family [Blastocatellia bacterium]|nr:putative toxin-antitoxin system toxin component, PIN family [Blastocatellia bacterium]
MEKSGLRVVLDCNVFVHALANGEGASAKILGLVEEDVVTLFVCDAILREIQDVLSRPTLRQLMPSITDELVGALLIRLNRKAVHIKNIPEEFRFERDPKDEVYVNLAIVTGSRYLITSDKDLLDLSSATAAGSPSFQVRYPMLKILRAQDFLAEIAPLLSSQ